MAFLIRSYPRISRVIFSVARGVKPLATENDDAGTAMLGLRRRDMPKHVHPKITTLIV